MSISQVLLPRIERQEARLVTLSALSFVCVAAGALVARSAGDALFLSHFGSGPLPVMYIIGAIASAIATYGCIRASRRFTTGDIAVFCGVVLVIANLVLFATFRSFPSFSRAGAYLVADMSVRIPVFLFWAFASEIFDAPQSRRLFGVIGSAGTAACLPAGLVVGPLARRAGAESLVILSAVLMAGFIAATATLMREGSRSPRKSGALTTGGRASARRAIATPQLATIAALAVMTSVVETIVDFQFKTTAAATASSTALANIFGTLYAVASVVSLVIQLVLVHRLLAVAGALVSLCVLPGTLLLSEAGIFRFRSASWVFITKALDVTLTTTINGTTRQLLYRGIRRESRLTARALADGLFLPLAIGTAGAGLALFRGVISLRAAAVAAAVGCAVWLLLARAAHAAYVSGLIDSLKARQFGSPDEEVFTRSAALEAWVRDAFGSASDEDLIYLASLVPQFGRLVRPAQLRASLARGNPKVKVAILQSLSANDKSLAKPLLDHADAEVRRAAIFACGNPVDVKASLADPDPRVRAAAAAICANAGDRDHLRAMAMADQPAVRAAAAEALESVAAFRTELLGRLLADGDVSVVLAALHTVKATRDAALVNPVLSLLSKPVLAGAASDALAEMGEAVIDAVLPLDAQSDAIVTSIPQVLERIGDRRGLDVIGKMLAVRAPEKRTAVFRSYVKLGGGQETLDALIAVECVAAKTRLSTARRLGAESAVRAARDAVSELAACHIQNAFILLGGRIRDVDTSVLHRQITGGTAEERSNAMELLENVLPKEIREVVLGMLDGGVEELANANHEVPALLWDRDSEWVVAGAAWAAAELALVSCGERLAALQHHDSPVVRETALFALDRLGVAR